MNETRRTHDIENVLVVGLLVEGQYLSEGELAFDVGAGSVVRVAFCSREEPKQESEHVDTEFGMTKEEETHE